ncbi:MAG: hypothetical protein ACUVRN_05905 [Candidatus Caldatribacteriaceae bacterium]
MKKLIGMGMVVFWILWLCSMVLSQEQIVSPLVKDLESMEKILYGIPQSGSVLLRIEKIEKDLIGDTLSGTLMERSQTLKTFIITGTSEEPSLDFKIRAVRLTLHSKPPVTGILVAELEELERLIFGVVSDEPIGVRVDRLYRTCVNPSQVKAFTVSVPRETLVKVALRTSLNSEKNEVGDPVPYEVLEDVQVEGVVVIARRTRGEGRIMKVRRKGSFGRSGRLQIDFGNVEAVDGTMLPLALGERAIKENEALAYAVGASIAGLALLGPVGAIAGIFVHGDPVKIEEGAEFFVEVSEERVVSGPLLGWKPQEEKWEEGFSQTFPEEEIPSETEGEVGWEEVPSETEESIVPEKLLEEEPPVEIEIKPFEEWDGKEGGK